MKWMIRKRGTSAGGGTVRGGIIMGTVEAPNAVEALREALNQWRASGLTVENAIVKPA